MATDPADQDRLRDALVNLLDVTATDWETSDLKAALVHAGVRGFNNDFISLSTDDIAQLYVPATHASADDVPLPLITKNKLKALLACFHEGSRQAKGQIVITAVTKANFDIFRTAKWDQSKPIVPWMAPIRANDEVSTWSKVVRPNKTEYKELRDEAFYITWKEKFIATLEAHSLKHLIDSSHVVTNPDLDEKQQAWLYRVFQDTCLIPNAKAIVTKYKNTKNTRDLWAELDTAYSSSRASKNCARTLSTYLTSNKYDER